MFKNLIIFVLLLGGLFLTRSVFAQDLGTDAVATGLGGSLGDADPRELVGRIINVALGFLGVIAVGFMIYGGFVWMTSNGEEEKVGQAKKILRNGIIGLGIILASWAIAAFIITQLGGATNGSSTNDGGCTDGQISYCGCGGSMVCVGSSWGSCIGSDCSGTNGPSSCDSNPNPGCQALDSICSSDDYCDDSCLCQPRGDLGDSCDIDLENPTCQADSSRCSEYLTCDPNSCVCTGPPVILGISPTGGFCAEDNNKGCSVDGDCDSTCNQDTPNGAVDNFITIFGRSFGEYSDGISRVVFMGSNNPREGRQPVEINPACVDSWQDDQIIIAVPSGANNGPIQIINGSNLEDTTSNDFGPLIDDFKINNISRPGLCYLSPDRGLLSSAVDYEGINLYFSDAYFGNYSSNVRALDSNFVHPAGLSGVSIIPNILSGESGSFVVNEVGGSKKESNYLHFTKESESDEGPYIMSFSPIEGAPGQYVTIKGSGFGGARGNNRVYFGDVEASYDFPAICTNSVWNDNQIIVKVPTGVDSNNYLLSVFLIDKTIDTQELNPNVFGVDVNGGLRTSICKINPKLGAVATSVTIYGEYFGNTGSEGTVQFNPSTDQRVYGSIAEEQGADLMTVDVPDGASTGPVKVIKNSVWGNEVNFEVGQCTKDVECGVQICCPRNTYKEGSCMNNLEECFVDIPNSVFEWSFSTKFTSSNDDSFESCAAMSRYFGSCQTGNFCPNASGVCSPYLGGNKQVVAECDFSCKSTLGCTGGLGSSLCSYNSEINKCVKNGSGETCSLNENISYVLGDEILTVSKTCNINGNWEFESVRSCPDNWTKGENDNCIDTTSSCDLCDGDLSCSLIGTEGRCVSKIICPRGSTCEDNPALLEVDTCVVVDNASCDCCCRIGQSASDCCAPLECAGSCGEDTNPNDDAGYGQCSGCGFVGTTTAEHDAACNCATTSGQYCDITNENPQGVCTDCSGLAGQDSCADHSAACCFDSNRTSGSNDDFCRGGDGEELTTNINDINFGYCAFYNCEEEPGDPSQCASTYPLKIGVFRGIDSCVSGCDENPGSDRCSLFNGQAVECIAEGDCCFNEASSKCLGAERIGVGAYTGYCAYYNCEDENPTVCDLNASTTGRFTSAETCSVRCASAEGGAGEACISVSPFDDSCAYEVCNLPNFTCLGEAGPPNSSDCGVCCCDPSDQTSCQSPETPNLFCQADKGSCSGENRGLCCGCFADSECGFQATVGCGFDACCQARPEVVSTIPANLSDNVCRNALLKVEFNQFMDVTTFPSNTVLLEERDFGSGVCPVGTFVYNLKDLQKNQNTSWLARIYNKITTSLNKLISGTNKRALADEPDPNKLYCSVPGTVMGEHSGDRTTLSFSSNSLFSPDTNYFLVIKGDEDLNSQSGVLSFVEIGLNGLGLDIGAGVYREGELLSFNSTTYKNSHIIMFSTLPDQGPTKGICAIKEVRVIPKSYLFNTVGNDLNEDDADVNDKTFDTATDKDKVFSARAYSSDKQILHPVTGYFWNWNWRVDNTDIATLEAVSSLPTSQSFVSVKPGITDDETKLWATVNMGNFLNPICSNAANCVCVGDVCPSNCCNDSSAGDGISKDSDLYVFICNNPWPPVDNSGEWYPWADNCDGADASCNDYNYKFYYCRDAGNEGTADDLPAIINKAIMLGQTNSSVCSSDRTPCSNLGGVCGLDQNGDDLPDGVCIWSVLKESYFFRETILPAGEITEATDLKTGGAVYLSWVSPSDQVDYYKIYYRESDSQSSMEQEVSSTSCTLVSSNYSCSSVVRKLVNNKEYAFRISVISVNETESNLSKEKFSVPTDLTPPSTPSNLAAEEVNGKIRFSWRANIDDVLLYRLYRGTSSGRYGESFDSVNLAISMTFPLNRFSGTNYFVLSAIDANNNESIKTAEIVVKFPVSE